MARQPVIALFEKSLSCHVDRKQDISYEQRFKFRAWLIRVGLGFRDSDSEF